MQYVKYIILAILVIGSPFMSTYRVAAASQAVMISQVQLGGALSGTAGQEYVQLYNNSSSDVEITNWCLTYTSASGTSTSSLFCMRPSNAITKIWLKARSYAMVVSLDLKNATGTAGDGTFTYKSGIASSGGQIRLFDGSNNELDRVSWGSVQSEPAAAEPSTGKVLHRVVSNGSMQDTDNSAADFIANVPILSVSGVYEMVVDVCQNIDGTQPYLPTGYTIDNEGNCVVEPPLDICPNIAELQVQMPGGYLYDDVGDCQPDSCRNIPELQVSIPEWFDSDSSGNCFEQDACPNLDGIQHLIPEGYMYRSSGICVTDPAMLELSEILPNPKGTDSGGEYIELHNPGNELVALDTYVLQTGVSTLKAYFFPQGSTIGPGEYKVFKDSDMGFTLTNTSGRVTLWTIDGFQLDDTGLYESAGDDMAWAKIAGVWSYTDTTTPGLANVVSQSEESNVSRSSEATLAACETGKYRNPLTNRCRTIETDASVLASCDSDQYRNPETGRCKKIASASTLTPCKDGQYRSEETNRCRNISAAGADLAACKEGQERNPETNRCRTVTSKSVPSAAYAVESVKDGAKAFVGWWAVGGIGMVALGYAAWEWRREVSMYIRKLFHFGNSQ